jgi:hypothetical protein
VELKTSEPKLSTEEIEPVFVTSSKYVRRKIEKGVKNALKGASPEWIAAAELAVYETALAMKLFNVDYVWLRFPKDLHTSTRKAYAIGPVMQKMEKMGLIRSTGEKGYSTIETKHHTQTIIWESLIYGDPDFK